MNAALVLQALIAALTHATELSQLFATANAEGRDLTDEETFAAIGRAQAALDSFKKKP